MSAVPGIGFLTLNVRATIFDNAACAELFPGSVHPRYTGIEAGPVCVNVGKLRPSYVRR